MKKRTETHFEETVLSFRFPKQSAVSSDPYVESLEF